jgi:hypothetical protein
MFWFFILIIFIPQSLLPTKFAADTKPLTAATEKRLNAKKLKQHAVVEKVLKQLNFNEMQFNTKLDFSNKKFNKLTDQEYSIFCWNAAKHLNPKTADFTLTELGRLSPENWTSFCWLLGQWRNLISLNLTATNLYLLNDSCWKNFLNFLEQSPNVTKLHLGCNGLSFFNSKRKHSNKNYSGNHRDDLIALGLEPDYGEEIWTRPSQN